MLASELEERGDWIATACSGARSRSSGRRGAGGGAGAEVERARVRDHDRNDCRVRRCAARLRAAELESRTAELAPAQKLEQAEERRGAAPRGGEPSGNVRRGAARGAARRKGRARRRRSSSASARRSSQRTRRSSPTSYATCATGRSDPRLEERGLELDKRARPRARRNGAGRAWRLADGRARPCRGARGRSVAERIERAVSGRRFERREQEFDDWSARLDDRDRRLEARRAQSWRRARQLACAEETAELCWLDARTP